MVEQNEHRCEGLVDARKATIEHPYHFTDSGLPNVYLIGIDYSVCPKCGKQSAEIPAVKQLLKLIARLVVEGEGRLTGAEIRFLRKRLGKKATEFAAIIGVTAEQVSRWENDSNSPEPSTDKLIRVCYALLAGDKKLQRKFSEDVNVELERWLTGLPGQKRLMKIQASRSRAREWKVGPAAA